MASDAERVSFVSRIRHLEKENQELRQEVFRLKSQVSALKAHDVERRTTLWKKLQSSIDSKVADISFKKPTSPVEFSEIGKLKDKPDLSEVAVKKDRPTAPQKPPPRTINAINKETHGSKQQTPPASAPPPPPPPVPPKLGGGSKPVRRVPEVMEFYRLIMKRDVQKENKNSVVGTMQDMNPRNMIGEIENRSTYLLAIKSDVELHGEFINYLTREVEKASFSDISEVEPFVKWLDSELSCLVDERAVLKHFPQWPERKADALREAACSFKELKNLELEVLSFKDNHKQLLSQSLRKMLALQDRRARWREALPTLRKLEKVQVKDTKSFTSPGIGCWRQVSLARAMNLLRTRISCARVFVLHIVFTNLQVVLMQIQLVPLNGSNNMENIIESSRTHVKKASLGADDSVTAEGQKVDDGIPLMIVLL
ncbi:non-motor actin binding protein [Lithospermum erythrorhizon]|uniref:Non-motor actin binding protein n=1 Tax=Lithospermum erythrorhizon TaxID=34254 RepID=A0AAV3NX93_LITER